MNENQWQTEMPEPEEGGYWWFYGFFDDHDPQLIGIALHKGEFYAFGEHKPLPRDLFIGMWMSMKPPIIPPTIKAFKGIGE